jgi:hypothetical protein
MATLFLVQFILDNWRSLLAVPLIIALTWFFSNRWAAGVAAIVALPLLTAMYNTQLRDYRVRAAAISRRKEGASRPQSSSSSLPMRDLASRNPGIVYSVAANRKLD